MKANQQYYFTLKGAWKRLTQEYNYFTKRPWTLEAVGNFWNTVEDYDEVNSKIYPYYRRFTNSYILSKKYLNNHTYDVLDVQARSGKGTEFWSNRINISSSVCIDFSDYLISLAEKRLKKLNNNCEFLKIKALPIPIHDSSFNLILCYETVEHIYEYNDFIKELSRLITKDGIIILTCPAVSWEWVHWLSAIININHSEGPHRFLKRKQLLKSFSNANLDILKENSTILLPFNNKVLIAIDNFCERFMPRVLKSIFMLRRSFILRKI